MEASGASASTCSSPYAWGLSHDLHPVSIAARTDRGSISAASHTGSWAGFAKHIFYPARVGFPVKEFAIRWGLSRRIESANEPCSVFRRNGFLIPRFRYTQTGQTGALDCRGGLGYLRNFELSDRVGFIGALGSTKGETLCDEFITTSCQSPSL